MQYKSLKYSLFLLYLLQTTLGCDQSKMEELQKENIALKNKVRSLQKENSIFKDSIDKLKNPPDKLYLSALNFEKSLQIQEATSEYNKLISWYPGSDESKNAKINLTILGKVNKRYLIFSDFKKAIKSKFADSSKAKLLSMKLLNNNIIVSAKHKGCDYFDVIFIDVGVAGYRSPSIKGLNFNKIILELHCGSNNVNKYSVNKSDILQYINLSINDPELISKIKSI